MKFYNEKAETMPRAEITAHQDAAVKKIVRYCYEKNQYFKEKFDATGVDVASFNGLEDLHKLPFMSKKDFRDQYPMGMCCVDQKQIAEMHMSSGSTGTPVVMPYTLKDLDQWAECMARCYVMAKILSLFWLKPRRVIRMSKFLTTSILRTFWSKAIWLSELTAPVKKLSHTSLPPHLTAKTSIMRIFHFLATNATHADALEKIFLRIFIL